MSGALAGQSRWPDGDELEEVVRHRVAATVQEATGGRVELKDLRVLPYRFTVEMQGIVLHGSEPAGEAPLFRASSLRLRWQILSLCSERSHRITNMKRSIPTVAPLTVRHMHNWLGLRCFEADFTT